MKKGQKVRVNENFKVGQTCITDLTGRVGVIKETEFLRNGEYVCLPTVFVRFGGEEGFTFSLLRECLDILEAEEKSKYVKIKIVNVGVVGDRQEYDIYYENRRKRLVDNRLLLGIDYNFSTPQACRECSNATEHEVLPGFLEACLDKNKADLLINDKQKIFNPAFYGTGGD